MPDWFIRLQGALLDFLQANQYWTLGLYVGVEEAGVPFPVPADAAIVVMGYQVYRGQANPAAVVAVVVASATLGASALYWVARLAGRRLLTRFGRFLRITPDRLRRAEYWFRRYQVPAVVIGRLIPGFRVLITVVAGVARGNFWLFVPSAAFSALIWSLVFMSLGWALGEEYERVVDAVRGDPRVYGAIFGGLILLVVVGLVAFRLRRRILRIFSSRKFASTRDEGT